LTNDRGMGVEQELRTVVAAWLYDMYHDDAKAGWRFDEQPPGFRDEWLTMAGGLLDVIASTLIRLARASIQNHQDDP
jgi:hypothetical protein